MTSVKLPPQTGEAGKAGEAKPMPEWPEYPRRSGPYYVYKGVQYTVCNDGNSADTAYNEDLASYWEARCRVAVEALTQLVAVCEATVVEDYPQFAGAEKALSAIGPLPPKEGE